MKKQITVLIVDDNKLMRNTLSLLISGTDGLQLAGEARSGEEAIALAKELSPDIILMDINMSPVNGFEATRKILKHNPAAKIIGLSLHTEPTYAKNMLKLGAKGYVTKSASHQEIIEAIMKVAAGGKYICNDLEGKI
jgi:two-component system, NarL family, invasion response regulator UvrY